MQAGVRPWHKAWPAGMTADIEIPEDVTGLLRKVAKANPDRVALSYYGQDCTFSFLDQQIDRFANSLIELGLKKGDRVAVFLQNSPQFVIGYFGALRAGAVLVCLNPMFKQAELEYEINDAGCSILLASDDLFPEVEKILDKVELEQAIVTWLGEYGSAQPGLGPARPLPPSPEGGPQILAFQDFLKGASSQPCKVAIDLHKDLALLQYTGGTTGLPKGAMITHHALAIASLGMGLWFANSRDDVYLGVTPFFHIMGMIAMMTSPLLVAGKVIVQSRFIPAQVAQAVQEHKITAWVGATTMLVALFNMPDLDKYDFSSFRYITTGGAPIGVQLQERLAKLVPQAQILEGYGLTETISQGGAVTPLGGYRPGFVGVPHLSDMKIVDLIDPKKELGPNQEGQILVKGPCTFVGYWNRPEESAEVLRDGWVHTGDVGLLDEQGYLKLLGRHRELIKCSGFSVFPAEVENLLYRHPAVAEVAVIGVPDDYRGESPKAYMVLKPEFVGKVTGAEMVEWAKENMSAYKRPREVVFCEELPKSGPGKILRRVLQQWHASA